MFEYNYNILTFDGHYSIDVGYFFSFTEYRHNFVHSLNNLLFFRFGNSRNRLSGTARMFV